VSLPGVDVRLWRVFRKGVRVTSRPGIAIVAYPWILSQQAGSKTRDRMQGGRDLCEIIGLMRLKIDLMRRKGLRNKLCGCASSSVSLNVPRFSLSAKPKVSKIVNKNASSRVTRRLDLRLSWAELIRATRLTEGTSIQVQNSSYKKASPSHKPFLAPGGCAGCPVQLKGKEREESRREVEFFRVRACLLSAPAKIVRLTIP
jgi:hypothetical protein